MIRTVVPVPAYGRVRAPPSKSYTHRALVTTFLSGGGEVAYPLDSDDTRATARGLGVLGAQVRYGRRSWTLTQQERKVSGPLHIDCGESGTTLRLLTAVAALGTRPVRFSGRRRLPYRPMEGLLAPLRALGAQVRGSRQGRALPFTIRGPIRSGEVTVSARESSQFVSALLLACSNLEGTSKVRLAGTIVSEPYIAATIAWLRDQGRRLGGSRRQIIVHGGIFGPARRTRVPGDASSAAYLWAAAATSGGRVRVDGIDPKWPQADLRVLEVLRSMGVSVVRRGSTVAVYGRPTRPTRIDLTSSPDLYPLAGVLAALVPHGTSHLRGAPHIIHKESDRRQGTLRLVHALGGHAQLERGGLSVRGTDHPQGFHLTDLTDHRLVMSGAVGALAGDRPSRLGDALAVRKSYPGFWDALDSLTRTEGRA